MASYDQLPDKDQIAAIEDEDALKDIRDEVDRAIARIETDLGFGEGDDEWARRARNSLFLHKYVGTMLDRRLRELARKSAPPKPSSSRLGTRSGTRRRTQLSAYTKAAFDGAIVDPDTVSGDLPALETAITVTLAMLNAIKGDRDDEILNFGQGVRDEDFLARAAVALRQCGTAHQALLSKAGAVRKAAKLKDQAQRDTNRPQAFVDAAREVLDRATFLAIWEMVDRRESLASAA